MIEISLFIDSNKQFENFKNGINDIDFEDRLAVITQNKISYKYYANNGKIYLYKSEIDENGDYNTIDKFLIDELPETLEDFFPKLLKLFL